MQCQFFANLKHITVSALLKKLGLNPIKLGVLRCTASEGPCHPNDPSSIQMKHFLRAVSGFPDSQISKFPNAVPFLGRTVGWVSAALPPMTRYFAVAVGAGGRCAALCTGH